MGDLGSIPGLGRSPREGKGYPLQYSSLENSMDYIVHGVAESDTIEKLLLSNEHRLNKMSTPYKLIHKSQVTTVRKFLTKSYYGEHVKSSFTNQQKQHNRKIIEGYE